jgi:hypothetical protein
MNKKKDPERIDRILVDVLSENGLLTYCKEFSIINNWPHLVDHFFSDKTFCDRVENGIVYVRVLSSPHRQEILFSKEKIISRIKEVCGCTTVKDIVFY